MERMNDRELDAALKIQGLWKIRRSRIALQELVRSLYKKYYDPKSDPDNPRWFCPEVSYLCHFPEIVPLPAIKDVKSLGDMVLVNNTRLSVQPVTASEFRKICKMGGLELPPGGLKNL